LLKNSTQLDSDNLYVISNRVFFLKLIYPMSYINKNRTTRAITLNNTQASESSNYTLRATVTFANSKTTYSFSNNVTILIFDSMCQNCSSVNNCEIQVIF